MHVQPFPVGVPSIPNVGISSIHSMVYLAFPVGMAADMHMGCREVLVMVMHKHQRYFPLYKPGSQDLLPHFITVANGPIDVPTVKVGCCSLLPFDAAHPLPAAPVPCLLPSQWMDPQVMHVWFLSGVSVRAMLSAWCSVISAAPAPTCMHAHSRSQCL